jgi:CheY-like chemotaxis protein
MTGYLGRFAIVEVLTMSAELERRISAGATADKIAEAARAGGMRSLWESGLRHVLAGESTVEELLRVTDVPAEDIGTPARRDSGKTARISPAHGLGAPSMPAATAPAAPAAPAAPPSRPAAAAPSFEALVGEFELLDEAPPESIPPVDGRGRGTLVLLVEDEDQLRRVMKDLLEQEGYRVAEARDGIQALDQVDRHAPDVIMLDLNLPGLDGYGVLQHLRSRPSTANIPVIVLTAKGDEDNEVRVFEMGADDFLAKPFRARALSARLEAVIGRRRP